MSDEKKSSNAAFRDETRASGVANPCGFFNMFHLLRRCLVALGCCDHWMLSGLKSESVPVDENKSDDEDEDDESKITCANNCSNPVSESESRKGSILTDHLCETDHWQLFVSHLCL